MILISMIIMNLTVATVIEGLESARKDNTGQVDSVDIENLVDLWQHYDHNATGWISIQDLIFLLADLPQPFNGIKEIKKYNFD